MEPTPQAFDPTKESLNEVGPLRAAVRSIRTRILSGLFLALPIALTFWIVYWLYTTILGIALTPVARLTSHLYVGREPPLWWERVGAPVFGILIVLLCLYILGLLVHTSLLRAVNWVLLHVPIVTPIYKALTNVVQSLSNQMQSSKTQRVVLVEFPHPGSRALAFVTNTLKEPTTGQTILCVCVLTGVMPPAGFTLYVPEPSVINLDWTVNQALQAILSGGMTSPSFIHYSHKGLSPNPQGAPIEPASNLGGTKPA